MSRLLKREYRKHQKSQKYLRLKEKYDLKFKQAASDYLDKSVRTLMEDDPGTAYKCLRRLAARPGDFPDDNNFTLTSHQEANLTAEESLEKISQHFASISQEFTPLDKNSLPPDVQYNINQAKIKHIYNRMMQYEIYK